MYRYQGLLSTSKLSGFGVTAGTELCWEHLYEAAAVNFKSARTPVSPAALGALSPECSGASEKGTLENVVRGLLKLYPCALGKVEW